MITRVFRVTFRSPAPACRPGAAALGENPRWHFLQRWPSPKATKKLRDRVRSPPAFLSPSRLPSLPLPTIAGLTSIPFDPRSAPSPTHRRDPQWPLLPICFRYVSPLHRGRTILACTQRRLISARNSPGPRCSMARIVSPSIPAAPPLLRTRLHASHRTSLL